MVYRRGDCMSKKIVIIGGGQLGRSLKNLIPEATLITRSTVDVTDFKSLSRILFDIEDLEVIVNTVAWTDVDGAEVEDGRETAVKVNADVVGILADIANFRRATLVHVSSDYVWDGKNSNHTEDEEINPMSVYGITKAYGDIFASKAYKHYIVRTSWLVGDSLPTDSKNNFVKTMVNLAIKGISPKVVDDQFGRLTFTSELSKAILHLIETDAEYGIYNVSNDGEVKDWCSFASNVFDLVSKYTEGIEIGEVFPVSTDEYMSGKKNVAIRPVNSDFNLGKIKSTGYYPGDYSPLLESYVEGLCKEFTQ